MNFCTQTASVWQIVGYGLLILKIVVPIILIIFGTIDFAKATISSDDKMIKDAAVTFAKRIIAGVAIFFVPTIIDVAFTFVAGFTESMQEDYQNCIDCLTSPTNKCDTSKSNGIFS